MMRIVAYCLVLIGCAAGDYSYKRPITYAGPIVYSDEKPPIINFPGPPASSGYKVNNYVGGGGYASDAKGSAITYVPLPLDDLPILIYQSQNQPPIHVINKQPAKDPGGYGGGSSYSGGSTSSYGGGGGGGASYGGGSASYGGGGASYGGGGYNGVSNSNYGGSSGGYGGAPQSNYIPQSNYVPPAPSSYGAAPKPVHVPKPPSTPSVYLPQVKPQYSAGGYGGSSSYGGGNYGGSSSYGGGALNYNNAGGYGSSGGSTYATPPHIVYSGHPPIHVYEQPRDYKPQSSSYNAGSSYGQQSAGAGTYGGGYGGGKPSYSAPPPKQSYVAAPPGYHKPPIIIYQGVRPPVHVYSEPTSYDQSSYGGAKSTYGGGSSGYAANPNYGGYSSKNGDEWEPLGSQDMQNTVVLNTEAIPEQGTTVLTTVENDKDFITTDQELTSK